MGILRDFIICNKAFFMLRGRGIDSESWATEDSVYIKVGRTSKQGGRK